MRFLGSEFMFSVLASFASKKRFLFNNSGIGGKGNRNASRGSHLLCLRGFNGKGQTASRKRGKRERERKRSISAKAALLEGLHILKKRPRIQGTSQGREREKRKEKSQTDRPIELLCPRSAQRKLIVKGEGRGERRGKEDIVDDNLLSLSSSIGEARPISHIIGKEKKKKRELRFP